MNVRIRTGACGPRRLPLTTERSRLYLVLKIGVVHRWCFAIPAQEPGPAPGRVAATVAIRLVEAVEERVDKFVVFVNT